MRKPRIVTTLILENHISSSPNHRTGKKFMAVKKTQNTAMKMPMLRSAFQYWMMRPAAVSSNAYVIAPISKCQRQNRTIERKGVNAGIDAQLSQYNQPIAKPSDGSTKRVLYDVKEPATGMYVAISPRLVMTEYKMLPTNT